MIIGIPSEKVMFCFSKMRKGGWLLLWSGHDAIVRSSVGSTIDRGGHSAADRAVNDVLHVE